MKLNGELTQQMAHYPNFSKEKVGPLLRLGLYFSSLRGLVAEPQDASLPAWFFSIQLLFTASYSQPSIMSFFFPSFNSLYRAGNWIGPRNGLFL